MPLSVLRGRQAPGDPWAETDQILALALTMFEDDLCPGCGHPRTYSMDIDARGHYTTPAPTRCHACTEIETRRSADAKTTEIAPTALHYRAVPDEGLRFAMAHPIELQPPKDATTTN